MGKGDIQGDIIYRDRASRTLATVGGNADSAGKKFSNMSKTVVAATTIALAGVAKFSKDSITAASNIAESNSKIEVVFGKSAGAVQKFASSSATSLGQSKQSALDAVATFATFGKMAGLQDGRLVEFSTGLTRLASDMASFSNTSPEEAIGAIGSALRGEAEPIRKYGVLLDDATLRNEALKLGLVKTTKEALTPQQKVLAAQAAIYRQTQDAQGDFARTSDGLANKQKIVAAQVDNLKVKLGTGLLPVTLKVVSGIGKTVEFLDRNRSVILPLVVVLGTLVAGIKIVTAATAAWNTIMALNPIGLVVIAIAALTAGLVVAYRKSETFRKIVNGAFSAVGSAGKAMWDNALRPAFKFIFDTWSTVVGGIVNGAAKAFGWVPGLGDKLKAAAERFNEFRDDVNGALDGIKDKTVAIKVTLPANRALAMDPDFRAQGIPAMAEGGIVKARPGGRLVLVGEAGQDEAIVPLGSRRGPTADVHYHFHLSGVVGDKNAVVSWIEQGLAEKSRRRGTKLAFQT